MSGALQAWIAGLELDRSLDSPERLRERIEMLDRLDVHFPHGADGETDLSRRAGAIRERLEAVNRESYRVIRQRIQQGGRREALLSWGFTSGAGAHAAGDNYDELDELVGGVLPFEPPGLAAEPAAEMVFYQPTPARHIFDLIDRLALDERDVLVDLGSGLGHVPLLVSICTNAHCIGIELEAAYVDGARRCARALKLSHATFVQQDARAADFSVGTVFYLYTPFTGTVLRTVLDALRGEAAHRSIRVCSFGPCTAVVAAESWLTPAEPPEAHRVAIFHSKP